MARLTDRARNNLKCVEGPLNRNQTKTKNNKLIIHKDTCITFPNLVKILLEETLSVGFPINPIKL